MKPSEVRQHLLGTRYDPVSLSEDTLLEMYAATHGAETVIASEGAYHVDVRDDVLMVVHHLLMMRWHAEFEQGELEAQQKRHAANMSLRKGSP